MPKHRTRVFTNYSSVHLSNLFNRAKTKKPLSKASTADRDLEKLLTVDLEAGTNSPIDAFVP